MSTLVERPPELYSGTAFDAFSPNADFAIGTARALMWASQLAYETHQPPTIAAVAPQWGFTRVTPFSETVAALDTSFDTRGLIVERGDATIVAFAGTDPAVWQNLVTDFNIVPTPDTDTHVGFTKALDAVWEIVRAAITQAAKPMMFAGHSLGAALAVLASQRAADQARPPLATYTFGLPRVGGKVFAEKYNARLGATTYRLVHGYDIVATVPMSRLGFRHLGRLLQCASGAKFDASALAAVGSDAPAFSDGLRRGVMNEISKLWRRDFFSPPGPGPIGPWLRLLPMQIRDHLPDRYIRALEP